MSTTGTQGGILMSQTNTMAMGGGQITQNVISANAPPQTLTSNSGPQTQMNMQVTWTYCYIFIKLKFYK
jgi:mediator of RNA polymerase II transcription subunit 25